MKKTTISKLCLLTLLLLGCAVSSCTDLSDLKNDLSELDARITALEDQAAAFNRNVEAIQLLTQATTVNRVDFADNVYTIVLSNGTTLTLTVGEAGVGDVPLVTLDENNDWMVDYQDGNGAVYLTSGGQRVCSTGKDAVTPVFGVDAEGYWTIDYGSGMVHVLDGGGHKVKASLSTEAEDPFFKDVVYDQAAATLTVTLRADDREIILPVVPDFLLAVSNADGFQIFDYGETKVYPVQSQGIGEVMIQTPTGWTAVLGASSLSITAPAASRATVIADSGTDVVVIAQSSSGKYVTISKVVVSLSDAELGIKPQATLVSAGAATATSLAFNITLKDATSYQYILQLAREQAPTLDEVKQNGIDASDLQLVVSGLSPKANYTIYLVARNGDIYGSELLTLSESTARPDYASYYEAYESGAEFEIGGLVISKAVFGAGKLLTEETKSITADGVYFVPDDVTPTHGSGTRKNLIIFGDNPAQKGNFDITARITFDVANNGHFVLYNLSVSQTGTNQIIFYPSNTTVGGNLKTAAFEDCRFDMTGFSGISFTASTEAAPVGVETISFVNCDINVASITYFFQYRNYGTVGKAIFRNNVIWSSTASPATRIFNNYQSSYTTAVPVHDFTYENNTWINCKPGSINLVKSNDRLVLRNNIFYANLTSYTPFISYETGSNPTSGVIENNLGYNSAGTTSAWKALYHNLVDLDNIPAEFTNFTTLSTDPFDGGTFNLTNGKFVPNATYSAYGAKR